MANTPLAQAIAGTVVTINESGTPVEFLVLQQGYPASGDGNTLLIRQDIYNTSAWGSTSAYNGSTVDTFCNTTYITYLDSTISALIPTVTIPYTIGNGNWTLSSLERQVFLLSYTEMNLPSSAGANVEGNAIQYFSDDSTRIANYNSTPTNYWTRTPYTQTNGTIYIVSGTGGANLFGVSSAFGVRPAFCLPGNSVYITSSGEITLDSGGNEMVIPSTSLQQGVEYNFRIYPRNYQNQFQTGVDGSRLHIVVADGNEAYPDDSGPTEIVPTYTGNSQIFGDGYKGYIEMYDSGVLTFNTDVTVDIFLVGGGGGGFSSGSGNPGMGGGGSGYTKTIANASFQAQTGIPVTIGAGGAAGANGGATSVGDNTVNGGSTGGPGMQGGNGGCGGGGGMSETSPAANQGYGGSNGSNGYDGSVAALSGYGGTGQGSTTCEFLDTQLRQFAGGGGGGNRTGASGQGGTGGGGNGRSSTTPATAGQANTGGGGGGGANYQPGASGGSGIAIIRWGDWTTA